MSQTATVRVRIDHDLKAEAEAILSQIGLNPSDAVRLLYKQVVLSGGLPFEVKIPNEETRRAMKDAMEGRNLTRYRNAEDVFGDL